MRDSCESVCKRTRVESCCCCRLSPVFAALSQAQLTNRHRLHGHGPEFAGASGVISLELQFEPRADIRAPEFRRQTRLPELACAPWTRCCVRSRAFPGVELCRRQRSDRQHATARSREFSRRCLRAFSSCVTSSCCGCEVRRGVWGRRSDAPQLRHEVLRLAQPAWGASQALRLRFEPQHLFRF